MELFKHNQWAYDKLVKSLYSHSRTTVIQPTGTGKSYIIAKLIKENRDKVFIYISSSNYIINQFKEKFKYAKSNTIFLTYNSLLFLQLSQITSSNVNYIVLDEFQRAGAHQWNSKLVKLFDIYPTAKIIGVTAIEIRTDLDKNGLKRNMVEEIFHGNIAHKLSLADAFNIGILPFPKYIKALYSLDYEYSVIKNKLKESQSSKKQQFLDTVEQTKIDWDNSQGVPTVLLKHIKLERSFIVFCRNIEHLEKMVLKVTQWFLKAFGASNINTYISHSKEPKSNQYYEDFKKNISLHSKDFNLLFTVDQLNEGIHIPNIDGLIFLRSTDSHLIFHQQWGRALETKGKRALIFDLVNNFSSNVFISDYRKIKSLVNIPEKIRKHYNTHKVKYHIVDETLDVLQVFEELEINSSSWGVRYDKYISEASEGVLSKSSRAWEQIQKDSFKANGQSILWKNRTAKLDLAEKYLGYNWKDGPNIYTSKWLENYHRYVEEAKSGKLSKKYKQWENNQKYQFKKDSAKWHFRKKLLDKADVYLGYNWLEGINRDIIWREKYNSYISFARDKGFLNKKLRNWENSQMTLYTRNVNSNIWVHRKKLMDEAEQYLKYSWLDNVDKKWFQKYGDYINNAKCGKLISVNRAWELQQKYLYNRSLEKSERWTHRKKLLDKAEEYLGYNWLS